MDIVLTQHACWLGAAGNDGGAIQSSQQLLLDAPVAGRFEQGPGADAGLQHHNLQAPGA